VSALLDGVAAQAPLALVIDDLHWADRATLDLLRHVARPPHEAALLIVGTYRDAEVGADHPLADLLADSRRDRVVERLALEGLPERDVGALIAAHAGHPAAAGLIGAVHEHTDGNPFFIEEVLRHLIEMGVLYERGGRWTSALTSDEIGVPEGVQEVLSRRLSRLSEPCRSVLAAAAVLGREFPFDVLLAMVDADEEQLILALEEALDASSSSSTAPARSPCTASPTRSSGRPSTRGRAGRAGRGCTLAPRRHSSARRASGRPRRSRATIGWPGRRATRTRRSSGPWPPGSRLRRASRGTTRRSTGTGRSPSWPASAAWSAGARACSWRSAI
jgi:hypothetical protein